MLDGFDLGVILSLTSSSEERRSILMTSLSNIWDANETWLVLMGGGLAHSSGLWHHLECALHSNYADGI